MKVVNCLDAESAFKKGGEALKEALHNVEGKVILFLSGGSSLGALKHVDYIPRNLTVALVDERKGLPENTNWYSLTQTNFYRLANASGAQFLNIPSDPKISIEECAESYNKVLVSYFKKSAGRVLSVLGIGSDGHIAGVMPHPEAVIKFEKDFLNPNRWVIGYDASGKNPYKDRITLSLDFLRKYVHQSVVISLGIEKCEALRRTLIEKGPTAEIPARILLEMNKVQIFTDVGICAGV